MSETDAMQAVKVLAALTDTTRATLIQSGASGEKLEIMAQFLSMSIRDTLLGEPEMFDRETLATAVACAVAKQAWKLAVAEQKTQ